MSSIKKALVVGGGIGGLSAGIALRKVGVDVDLIELHPAYNVYGVGIIQPSNALRALDSLGLADECIRRGSPYNHFNMGLADGTPIGTSGTPGLGHLPAHNGISRRVLHEVILEGTINAGVHLFMGKTVTALDDTGAFVDVTFSDGSTGTYDIVVGADGINSQIRRLLFGDAFKPHYTGQSVWRYAFDRIPELDNALMYFGRKTKVGLVPMAPDKMYMFCVTSEGDDFFIPEDELIPRLKAHLSEYPSPIVAALIDQITDPKGVICRPLETILVPKPWYKGRVVLIGDAVHGTIPQLGQGASLAIEDAVVLGELIGQESDIQTIFETFMNRRFDRCKMVVDVSAQIGEWEQLDWKGQLPEGVNIGRIMGQTLGAMAAPI
ncbi:FAD-dependent oxidoreductase [uncultured Fibrella sp.]|uniref:FAD-dependent oxidoreductase n=1 Tax=uncultured Fibrella sp. TaxID=1284596 RepID=UPI0035CAB1EF